MLETCQIWSCWRWKCMCTGVPLCSLWPFLQDNDLWMHKLFLHTHTDLSVHWRRLSFIYSLTQSSLPTQFCSFVRIQEPRSTGCPLSYWINPKKMTDQSCTHHIWDQGGHLQWSSSFPLSKQMLRSNPVLSMFTGLPNKCVWLNEMDQQWKDRGINREEQIQVLIIWSMSVPVTSTAELRVPRLTLKVLGVPSRHFHVTVSRV